MLGRYRKCQSNMRALWKPAHKGLWNEPPLTYLYVYDYLKILMYPMKLILGWGPKDFEIILYWYVKWGLVPKLLVSWLSWGPHISFTFLTFLSFLIELCGLRWSIWSKLGGWIPAVGVNTFFLQSHVSQNIFVTISYCHFLSRSKITCDYLARMRMCVD